MSVARWNVDGRAPGRPSRPHERRGERPRPGADPDPYDGLSRTARRAAAEDARLLAWLRAVFSLPSVFPRVIFLALGFTAITSLAFAYAEALPLPYGLRYAVAPAAVVVCGVGLCCPAWGRRALLGWTAGVIATGIYDLLRLGLVWAGLWGDPIPGIGRLALASPHASFLWGYVWRFAGNGGGMGLAFAMLPWRGVRSGIAYGSAVCLGLLTLLFLWPVAQTHFFPLTPVTAAGAMAGHWVYGAVLGFLISRWLPPVRRRGQDRTGLAPVRHIGTAPRRAPAGGPEPAPLRLSASQLHDVGWALGRGPRWHGFASDQWTLSRVALVVERVTGRACERPAHARAVLDALGWRVVRGHPEGPSASVS